MTEQKPQIKWAKVIDHTRCIGCHACTTACKSENVVPLGVTRTYVKHVDVGEFPQTRRAHQATLDPLAARRPAGGLFMWSEQRETPEHVVAGNPTFNNSSAAALLSYDVSHSIPWDWRVSLYTWTKGISAGVYLVASLLVLFGYLRSDSSLWLWAAPVLSGAFLGLTGALLIWDLEHPERFFLIFTRPQWRSWLVKGAFIIAGYTLLLALHFLASWLGSRSFQSWLMIAGIPLSILTAIYTAYLFAQAKARDMWQNPLLPPHLLIQASLLVSPSLLPLAFYIEL